MEGCERRKSRNDTDRLCGYRDGRACAHGARESSGSCETDNGTRLEERSEGVDRGAVLRCGTQRKVDGRSHADGV